MSVPSCELKLRNLAAQNAALVAALTFTVAGGTALFAWFDRQLAQGDIGKPSDGRACVTVQRISTARVFAANQGGPVQPLSQVRLQINVISYNAEQARQTAALITAFLQSVSLLAPGEFQSPVVTPNQTPNWLLNERSGMLPQVNPPAYVQTQDWRIWNAENLPSS